MLMLTYTPVGLIIPFSNPQLDNKYSKELISLNQRMMNLMEQFVELRSYNLKLRRALGENVIISDSGVVKNAQHIDESEKSKIYREDQTIINALRPMSPEQHEIPARSAAFEGNSKGVVAFPAILPTEGYLTKGFEPAKNHFGLDIAGKTGTIVVAAADGNIAYSGWTYDDGYIVIISHTGGFMTFYKHNQSILKSAGSFVRRGEPIATLGNSGISSSGPHLHFEIWKDGIPVDPSSYLINFYL
jgi:murein DD-endopeptidase MepM/ murein hydrolase activator NlpD